MKKSLQYVSIILISILVSCNKKDTKADGTPTPEGVEGSNLRMGNNDALTFKGPYPTTTIYNVLDEDDNQFFIRYFPSSVSPTPTPLIIAIHGGSFIGGNMYGLPVKVQNTGTEPLNILTSEQLNNKGYAFASINYTLINTCKQVDENGTLVNVTCKNTLQDCKDFLDYIIKNAAVYNIDSTKIVLLGSSAGASTSLWLGLNNSNNYADNIKGIVAMSPQASLNFPRWRAHIFAPTGLANIYDQMVPPGSSIPVGPYPRDEYLKMMYGTINLNQINQYSINNHLNFLDLIDSSDPELFLGCFFGLTPYGEDIIHNRAHICALKNKADQMGLTARIMYNNTPFYWNQSENVIQFCARKFQ